MSSSVGSFNALWLLVGVPFIAYALFLLIRGLRGRIVDDHPHCARCGYDLFGNPAAQKCSECGAELSAESSTRIGHREREWASIAVGVVLLMLTTLALGYVVFEITRAADWNRVKPAGWLQREAFGTDRRQSQAAWGELTRRVTIGHLSDRRASDLVDWVLANQADRQVGWCGEWGDFVEALHDRSRLEEQRWKAYLEQSSIFDLTIRRRIRLGATIPVHISGEFRLGSSYEVRMDEGLWHFGPWQETRDGTYDPRSGCFQVWSQSRWLRFSNFTRGPVPPGRYPVQTSIHLAAAKRQRAITGPPIHSDEAPMHSWDVTLQSDVEVVPEDQPTVTLVDDPQMASQMRALLQADPFKTRPAVLGFAGQATTCLACKVYAVGSPVEFAFSASIRKADGVEQHVGRFTSSDMDFGHSFILAYIPETPDADLPASLTLILRPSIEAAEETIDIERIWRGTIEIPDVPVEQDP
jgi:hypothetical protein